jgi:hypothetical protein
VRELVAVHGKTTGLRVGPLGDVSSVRLLREVVQPVGLMLPVFGRTAASGVEGRLERQTAVFRRMLKGIAEAAEKLHHEAQKPCPVDCDLLCH